MYTLDYTLEQLERCSDRITAGLSVRIIHILCEDRRGSASSWEDRYVVMVDCDPQTYLMLCLL